MKKIFFVLIFLSAVTNVFSAEETIEGFSSKPISYNEILATPKAVVFLWTSRCPYCANELRNMNLNKNISHYARFFFVNLGERKSDVERIVKSLGLGAHITQNIYLDKNAITAEKFSIIGVPTFIFMINGKIVDRSYYFDENKLKEIFKEGSNAKTDNTAKRRLND